jgi:hypothetical protein
MPKTPVKGLPKTLLLLFGYGKPLEEEHHLKETAENGIIDLTEPGQICTFLDQFFAALAKPNLTNVKDLLICGHSSGMRASILLSFILLGIQKHEDFMGTFGQYFDRSENGRTLARHLKAFAGEEKIAPDLRIHVVGTGGEPTLFRNEPDFTAYMQMMQHRYLHVACGVTLASQVVKGGNLIHHIDEVVKPHLFCHYILSALSYRFDSVQEHDDIVQTRKIGRERPDAQQRVSFVDVFNEKNAVVYKYLNPLDERFHDFSTYRAILNVLL